MISDEELFSVISAGGRQLVEAARRNQQEEKHHQLGVHHWLLALIERHGAMVEALVTGLNRVALQHQLREELRKGNTGAVLEAQTVIQAASRRAQARARKLATEQDLAAVVLTAAGYALNETALPEAGAAPSDQHTGTAVEAPSWSRRARKPTPTLEQFGRDLTSEAAAGKLGPLVGREAELAVVIETLCRPTKRNPVLIGSAGVGKTAIIEGLAQRIITGNVPSVLKGVRILALQPSTVVAGASVVGELEKRIKAILAEASQDGIIVFIDEVHSMVGAGGREGSGDVASLVKPALARGDLACIAATTDDEYRRYIEPDEALARRFQPIRVQELTAAQTIAVLKSIRDVRARTEKVQVPDEVLEWLVSFSQQFLHNRYFPDKAVDLLEQCIGYGRAHDLGCIAMTHAEEVTQRMVGMPISPDIRLQTLREKLTSRGLMNAADQNVLSARLAVTLRGLDIRPSRPNAVILLAGAMAETAELLAQVIAEALFGGPERVVEIDFSRFQSHYDLSMLIGAAPGLVGYDAQLPIHRVANMPWCVVRGDNIDRCHPGVRAVFMQAIKDGYIADARSRRIYLSDTVILLTSMVPASKTATVLGFEPPSRPTTDYRGQNNQVAIAEQAVGAEFATLIDLVCTERPAPDDVQAFVEQLLTSVTERFRNRGVELSWDRSVTRWLLTQPGVADGNWERVIETQLLPRLVNQLAGLDLSRIRELMVWCRGDEVVVAVTNERR